MLKATSHLSDPKTKPTGRHPSNAFSAAYLRLAPPERHADGNGLYFLVPPSGTRSWIQRLVLRARRWELGLGSVALVPLAEAREKALANRKLAREGGDPLAEKRRTEGIPAFAKAASRVLEQKRDGWRNRCHHREWMSSLRRYAFPRIGKMPVSEVTSADLLEILTPIRHRKVSSARRVRQRLRAILEWAVAMEYGIDNPCDRIGPVLGPQHDVTEHMRALPHREVSMGIENCRVLGTESVRVRVLPHGGSGATGVGQRAGTRWRHRQVEKAAGNSDSLDLRQARLPSTLLGAGEGLQPLRTPDPG